MAAVPTPDWPVAERWYRRHAALVRITHWINVVCFIRSNAVRRHPIR